MNARVFWMETAGGEEGDGAWYWVETDEAANDFGEPHGPFKFAISAGADARRAIVARAQRQPIAVGEKP